MAEVEALTLEPTETMAEAEVLSQDFEEKVLVTMEDAVKGADKDDEDEEDEPLQMNRVVDSTIDQHEEENPPTANENDWGSSLFVSEDNISVASEDVYEALNEEAVTRDGIAIIVPQVENAWEYHRYEEEEEEPRVEQILEEYNDGGILEYLVQYTDGLEEVVTFDELRELENGPDLLDDWVSDLGSERSDTSVSAPKASSRSTRRSRDLRNKHLSNLVLSSDDELTVSKPSQMGRAYSRRARSQETSSGDESHTSRKRRKFAQPSRTRPPRKVADKPVNYFSRLTIEDTHGYDSADMDFAIRREKYLQDQAAPTKKRKLVIHGPRQRETSTNSGTRRPQRSVKARDIREIGEDEIPEQASTKNAITKYASTKEVFKRDVQDKEFYKRHCQTCDVCSRDGDNDEKGLLVYCQGCTISYHQVCLGPRSTREHLVTKIGEKDFVLQCRRCIGLAREKDSMAPDQGFCQVCQEVGDSTSPFRNRKTPKEEQKEREENDGEDPIVGVDPNEINNADTVLFRCLNCYRGYHLYHLPPQDEDDISEDLDEAAIGAERFHKYHKSWLCKDCTRTHPDVESLVAWRPANMDRYEPGQTTEMIPFEYQEYLIKWKKLPYIKSSWMPGVWVWSVTVPAMRKAFARKEKNDKPKMTLEEAIPEDYHRIDIVFNVSFTNVVKHPTEKVAKARIKEVRSVLVKFKGLNYEDLSTTEPPKPEETERWSDFQTAYEEFVMGSFIHPPVKRDLDARLSNLRAQNFENSVVLSKQPEGMVGGQLMSYQLEGLNWLYYQWFQQKNAILADEMGLGKTIQVIGFITALNQIHGCWPFLIVVPNSTCPNWRRECKKWAPSLRVVTYYGSAEARRFSAKFELFPNNAKDLRCHVVVTSYDAAQDEQFRTTFRSVKWAGLVVDEGQRLKNDKNILYGSLNALKAPFKVLLTGTPLQNNARELFNLLQFLDPTIDAAEMEAEYATLTKENLAQLHSQLQGMFLRRTKAEVLKFLPSMAQIILPVTMSVLQKRVYKTILEQNPELMRSIVGTKKNLNPKERANLNNILMQLRKCLAHPFVYSRSIEEVSSDTDPAQSYRRLVDASSKLQLLEIMLPKLQERGHRVLIFSQFLNMLDIVEDFLAGLGFFYNRLDGNMGSLEKQKRIDAFNAPDSNLFAFLLSTRAGGVGINLATADTVIILDPDFNPHQDIQALSRAHRIGQKKKVLVFQMTTRNSAEERMMQIGKKKMALDHLMIEQMGSHDDDEFNVESILKHGADALFKDDENNDIKYDSASVDRLLDRSQIEDTQANDSKTAESQFSFARVWVNDKSSLEEGMNVDQTESDPSVWDNILKERARQAQENAAKEEEQKGRGRRKRQTIDYSKQTDAGAESSRLKKKRNKNKQQSPENDSDMDFQGRGESEDDAFSADEVDQHDIVQELEAEARSQPHSRAKIAQASPVDRIGREFKRAKIQASSPKGRPLKEPNRSSATLVSCIACGGRHVQGYCPLKLAGPEFCNLCGTAHYGSHDRCMATKDPVQLQGMLHALKSSVEPLELKGLATNKTLGSIEKNRQRAMRKQRDEDRGLNHSNGVGPASHQAHSATTNGKTNGDPQNPMNKDIVSYTL